MAKRKLSAQQRAALRKELAAEVKAGTPLADIVRKAADKYGLATITVRWYLKSLSGGRRAAKAVSAAGTGLARSLKTVADRSLKRVLRARKLIPAWQAAAKREANLGRQQARVEKALKKVSAEARSLHRRIERLMSR